MPFLLQLKLGCCCVDSWKWLKFCGREADQPSFHEWSEMSTHASCTQAWNCWWSKEQGLYGDSLILVGKALIILWIIMQGCSSPFRPFEGESLKFGDLQTYSISSIGDILQRPSSPWTWNIFDSYLRKIFLAIRWEQKLQADGSEKLWQYSADTEDRYLYTNEDLDCWDSWKLAAELNSVHLQLNRHMGGAIFDQIKTFTYHSIQSWQILGREWIVRTDMLWYIPHIS